MEDSHFEGGLKQRAWLSQKDEEAERTTEGIRGRLEENLELIEEGFSPSEIESLDGAPDEVVEAASGENIEDLDLDRVAEYLATEKWNYPFDADISRGEADIAVDEAHFDLWHSGSVKVTATYQDSQNASPGITALSDTYPDRELEFDGTVYSRKPEEAQQKYEEAVQTKREVLVEELNENPDEMAEALDIETEEIPEVDENGVSPFLDLTSDIALRYTLEDHRGRESEYWEEANEARALVVDDAVERLQEAGITLDSEGDFDNFESYDDMVDAVRNGEATTLMVDLEDSSGIPLRLSLYAEDGHDLGFDQPSKVGYQLEAFDERGLETLTEFYGMNTS
jgi:hypothetical protein